MLGVLSRKGFNTGIRGGDRGATCGRSYHWLSEVARLKELQKTITDVLGCCKTKVMTRRSPGSCQCHMCIPLKSTHAHDCPLLLREAQRSCVCFPGPALALHCREPSLHLTGWGSEHLNSRLPASGKQRQPRGGEKGLRGDGAEPTLMPRNTIRPSGGGRSGFGGRAPELQPRLSASVQLTPVLSGTSFRSHKGLILNRLRHD